MNSLDTPPSDTPLFTCDPACWLLLVFPLLFPLLLFVLFTCLHLTSLASPVLSLFTCAPARVASPLLVVFVVLQLFLFTCDPACRLPVSSPPLQEEEVVAPLGHPELQSVFQQNFLRVQPHFVQQGGTGGSPPPSRSLQRRCIKFSPARERPDRSYSGGFSALSMIVLRSLQLQASDFLTSAPSRPICSSCTHQPKIVYWSDDSLRS